MRIIAGQWRGRTIEAPPGQATRPILDRAKTVLFDMLGHRLATPGQVPPTAVLDVFAGSGALGIEALSRGATFCTFIEKDRKTAALIGRNIDKLHAQEQAQVLAVDALRHEWQGPPPQAEAAAYRLVFVDPPYHMLETLRPGDAMSRLLDRLATSGSIATDALLVIRHGIDKHNDPDLLPLLETERRDVGTMAFRFCRKPSVSTPDASTVISDAKAGL